jgi:hypothetical protein
MFSRRDFGGMALAAVRPAAGYDPLASGYQKDALA